MVSSGFWIVSEKYLAGFLVSERFLIVVFCAVSEQFLDCLLVASGWRLVGCCWFPGCFYLVSGCFLMVSCGFWLVSDVFCAF